MGTLTLARLAVLGAVVAPFVSGAKGTAADDRHPTPAAIAAPTGVPASYVLTHNGWFHSSCVVRVRSDEMAGADRVIRGKDDGAAHFAFASCAYPRFDLRGRAMSGGADGAAPPVHAAPQPAAAIYDRARRSRRS